MLCHVARAHPRREPTYCTPRPAPTPAGAAAAIAKARKISNPGCYATGAQVALMPLLPGGRRASGPGCGSATATAPQWDPSHVPTVFGVSGYSGAGTTPGRNNDPAMLR